jgi:hypothetical protein
MNVVSRPDLMAQDVAHSFHFYTMTIFTPAPLDFTKASGADQPGFSGTWSDMRSRVVI